MPSPSPRRALVRAHALATRALALVPAAALVAGGCIDRPTAAVQPTGVAVEQKDVPASGNRDVDLLFVVDDSNSMRAEQDSLRAHFPDFIHRLSSFPGGLPDVHIGIISTDVGTGTTRIPSCTPLGDDGHLITRGCAGLAAGATFLSDLSVEGGARARNYTGDLADVFACMADLGVGGCGAEQPLESLRLALDPARGANPGFLRDGSLLAVVIISDEDDCSTRDRAMFTRPGSIGSVMYGCTEFGIQCDEADLRSPGDKHHCAPRQASPYLADVDDYVRFLQGVRPDPRQLVVAAITGQDTCVHVETDPDDATAPLLSQLHVCDPSIAGAAYPAIRTRAFRSAFTNQAFVPIGNGDLAAALDQVARAIVVTAGSWCLENELVDLDGDPTDGVQADCAVTDVAHAGTAAEQQTVIPACDAGHTHVPCWSIARDDAQCATFPTHDKLDIDRGGVPAPDGTVVHAQCLTK